MNREFWYDVLRSGAVLGLIMSLSFIFERYLLAYSDMSLLKASSIYFIEWLIMAIVFIWLLVRFARKHANTVPENMGFSYAQGLAYILLVSMLTGVMVGVVDTIFIGTMGYEQYVDGVISRILQMKEIYSSMGISANDLAMFDEYTTQLRYAPQPSMLFNVLGHLQMYMVVGGLPGFIIAGVLARSPKSGDFQN